MQKCNIQHCPTQLPWPDQLAIVMRGVIIEKDKENARLMRRQIIRWDFWSYNVKFSLLNFFFKAVKVGVVGGLENVSLTKSTPFFSSEAPLFLLVSIDTQTRISNWWTVTVRCTRLNIVKENKKELSGTWIAWPGSFTLLKQFFRMFWDNCWQWTETIDLGAFSAAFCWMTKTTW